MASCTACRVRGGGVVAIGPDLPAVRHFHELHVDPHGLSGASNTPVNDVVGGNVPVSSAATHEGCPDRIRMKDLDGPKSRELGRGVLDESPREVVMGRIA